MLRAYTISSLAVLLLVVAIALLIWRAYLIYQGAAASSANVAGNPNVTGYLIGGLLGSIVLCVGITAGIGVAAYFISGKSHNAANGAMDVVLLLAILLYGVQIYAWLNSPRYAAIQQAQAGGGAPGTSGSSNGGPSNGVDTLADRMKAANERNKAQSDAALKRSQEQMEAQRKAAAEQAQRMREQMDALRQNRPPTAPQPTPRPTPSPNQPSPNGPATSPRTTPPPRRAPATEEEPKVAAALAAVRKDADGRVDPVAALADDLLLACKKAPEASFSAIDDRLKKLKSLRQTSTDLRRWLGDFDKTTDKALIDAGIDSSAAMGPRIRFTSEYRATSRAMVCDQIIRFCDETIEEAELLRGKIGKWRLGGDGKIDTKDRDLESKARMLRMRIDSTTDQRVRMVDQLNGR